MRRLLRIVVRLGIVVAVGAVIKRLVEGSRPEPVADGWTPTVLDRPTPSPATSTPASPAPDEVDSPAGGEGADTPAKKKAPAKKAAAKKKAPAKKAAAKKKAPAKADTAETAEPDPGHDPPGSSAG